MPYRQSDPPLAPALATPPFAQRPEPASDALHGPLGLRAGWGILLFFLLAAVLGVLLFFVLFKGSGRLNEFRRDAQTAQRAAATAAAAHTHLPQPPAKLSLTFLMEATEAGAVLLAAWSLARLEKRRFGVYGLGSRHLRDALPGAACGLLALAALVGLLRGLHLLVFDDRRLHGAAAFRFGAEWLLVFLLVGIFEEFFFRGYVQFTLMRGLLGLGGRLSPARAQQTAFWLAAVLLSTLFSATHLSNAGEDPAGIAAVFVAGLLFSYALWRTGSLWWGVGFHMAWDWAQSFLFGVPDSGTLSAGRLMATHATGNPLLSGGQAGPEGSVLVLPTLLLVAAVIRLHPQAAQPPVEPYTLPPVPQPAAEGAIP